MNEPNMAKPDISAVMFVSSTGRSESTRMSISGSSTLSSSTTQSTAQTAEKANSPRVAADVQPQLAPSDSARRNVTRTTDIRAAPGTSMREVERTGDSGMNRCTSRIATATPKAPMTNSQRQLALSTISPEMTSPSPTPNTAERSPMPTFIRSGGNSSRMIPKLSGNTAPAAPETMRNRISVQMSGAAAQPMQPMRNVTSERTSSRSLP